MLTNGAMSSTTYAVSIGLMEADVRATDVNISYLPASHVFERELQVIPTLSNPSPLFAGFPKGVMISTFALTSSTYAVDAQLQPHHYNARDTAISYLPAAHAFERGSQVFRFYMSLKSASITVVTMVTMITMVTVDR